MSNIRSVEDFESLSVATVDGRFGHATGERTGGTPLPPIWVINLPRSVERREETAAELDRLNLDYEFLEAVDGRELSKEELARDYDPELAKRTIGRELSPGEIGCSLSHLRAYQRMLDEGLEEVVILEDDAALSPAFVNVLRHRDRFPDCWELVLLYRFESRASRWGSRAIVGPHRCVRLGEVGYSGLAYLLRASGARKMVAANDPVRVPSDFLTGGKHSVGVQIHAVDPPCAGERIPYGEENSTMPEAYAARTPWPTREELGPIFWIVHKCKWGLIRFWKVWNPFHHI